MSSTESQDWSKLLSIWADHGPSAEVPSALVRSVQRATLRQALTVAGEWLLGAGLFAFALAIMIRNRGIDTFVWGFAVCWFTAMALDFSYRVRRGTWQAAGRSTLDYLALARERVQGRRRMIRFQWKLLGLEVLFLLGWHITAVILQANTASGAAAIRPFNVAYAVAVIAVMTAALAAWTWWTQRSIARETQTLDQLATSFDEPAAPSGR
jgi:mannose/fructose/N-acetylgalactosamine-specific phosphotransferase system component IIC